MKIQVFVVSSNLPPSTMHALQHQQNNVLVSVFIVKMHIAWNKYANSVIPKQIWNIIIIFFNIFLLSKKG